MPRKCWLLAAAFACLSASAWAGSFGKVVAIGGHASDLALDEARGVAYVANFTAGRVEVLSLRELTIQTSMNVAPQPASLAISPDGHFLVVTHYAHHQPPQTSGNAVTVVDLRTRGRQTFALGNPPLAAAFGADNLAVVATTTGFVTLDPVAGTVRPLMALTELAARALPVPPASIPANIVSASMAASGDGTRIYGLADRMVFSYDVTSRRFSVIASQAGSGPRVVSVNGDGTRFAAGASLYAVASTPWGSTATHLAELPDLDTRVPMGSHAIDSSGERVYAQAPTLTLAGMPVLELLDGDNLTVRERLRLPENLTGKSLLSSDGSVLYSVSDSGLLVLPVGSIRAESRLAADVEELLFRGNFCDRRLMTQEFRVVDPGGGSTSFTLRSTHPGVRLTPTAGATPATIRVTVDPVAFQASKGTVAVNVEISSPQAVNLPPPVRVLVNSREPDQRGTTVHVPGKLVDILPDPARDRFFVLRQDANLVLVFDANTYHQLAALRTGHTPTQMAVSFDRRYLFVGNGQSQIANVYDLETLEALSPVRFPEGHFPRSVAISGKAALAVSRITATEARIARLDLGTRTASELPLLGIYENRVRPGSVLAAAPNGATILLAQSDGTLMLYNANTDSYGGAQGLQRACRGLRGFQLRPLRRWRPDAECLPGDDACSGRRYGPLLRFRFCGPGRLPGHRAFK